MKVLQFTIPVAHDNTIIVQEDNMAHFYPYLHRHKEAQLMWIKEGEGTLVVDNNMHTFRKNDIYLLGANQPHLFKSNAEYFQEDSTLKIQALISFLIPTENWPPFWPCQKCSCSNPFYSNIKVAIRCLQPMPTV
ncbi:AraC family ligand binding domain-containing protein [Pedobacter sp. UC225_65]|uniref:AraC family ligand binding domain-containing protein n=1 Tax=Pedobacter sp. UC225_65 TaxID=3350173 RepID=UPI00367238F1